MWEGVYAERKGDMRDGNERWRVGEGENRTGLRIYLGEVLAADEKERGG